MRNKIPMVLSALVFSSLSLGASAAPDLRGGKLEKIHDDSGGRFGEYGGARESFDVPGRSGESSRFKLSRSAHRAASRKKGVPGGGSGGSGTSSAGTWRLRGGIAGIVAGAALFGLVVSGIIPAVSAGVAVGWGAALAFAGLMTLLYPWK